jgi:hypothetical protein
VNGDVNQDDVDPRPFGPRSSQARPPTSLPVPPPHDGPPPDDADAADELMVRPFLLTGGRTRPLRDDLRVESLIQSQGGVLPGSLRFEARRIYEMCRLPSSVAEIAAALGVPLGVTRVLVCDLIADGYATLVVNERPTVAMLERILDRVRAL